MTGQDPAVVTAPESMRPRLGSWKEIAAYLGRGVRSVQRWEREEGLPVHRLSHQKRGSVYAYQDELDAWWESRRVSLVAREPELPGLAEEARPEIRTRRPLSRKFVILLTAILVAGTGLYLYFAARPTSKRDPTLRQLTRMGTVRRGCSLSTDGRLIAFTSDAAEEGNLDIWVQPTDGAQARRLTHDPEADVEPVISPDSTKLLFTSRRTAGSGIYQISTRGGGEKLLIVGGERPRYSQNGKWIAYLSGGEPRHLCVADSQGGNIRQIPTGLAVFDHPIWSPDDKYLMVNGARNPGDAADWWVIPALGGEPINTQVLHDLAAKFVTSLRSFFYAAAWVPGDRIFFAADQRASWSIWRIQLSAGTFRLMGNPERMTGETAADVSFSFAANHLAFVNGALDSQLWKLPVDANRGQMTGLPRRISRGGPSLIPSLSADGRVLAYATARQSRNDVAIVVRNLESGEEKTVASASSPQRAQYTTLSRDGSKVAYGIVVPEAKRPIYIYDLITQSTRKLCDDCEGRPYDWSLNGTALVLSMPGKGVGLFDLDTRARSMILSSGTSAMFSPDGRWLAASVGSVQVGSRVFIAPYRGPVEVPRREWIPAGGAEAISMLASWSPDGKLLYYVAAPSFSQTHPILQAQRFDPQLGQLVGRPFAVYRFEEPFLPLLVLPLVNRLAVSRDQIILASGGWKGDVWMTEVDTGKIIALPAPP